MVPIVRACADPRYALVVAAMGAQMGKTEALFNVLGHRLVDGPYVPALYIGPTQKQVRSVMEDRIGKMIRSTPALWARLEKGRRNRVTEKYIAGVRLGAGWAGSATELSSHPAGIVLVDERDRMGGDVDGEGDPVTLARARTKNYANSKVIVVSTPTIEGASPIWSLWEEGTRCMWAWPCPHCGDYFVPRLSLLHWPEGATPQQARESAYVVCPSCGGVIASRHKASMNAAGKYLAHEMVGEGDYRPLDAWPSSSTASFWVSGLASPWQGFGEIAEVLVSAYRSGEDERIQAAINTYCGEIWRTRGDAPAWQDVYGLRQDYRAGELPAGVQLITAGVDVQKRGLYYVIRGWGHLAESWLLRHGFIAGETEYDDVWMALSRVLQEPFAGGMQVARAFIDSGYRPGDTERRPDHAVYTYCRRTPQCYPTKGQDSQDRPLRTSQIDITVGGRTVRGGVQLWNLDSDHCKSWVFSRVRWPAGEPGGWHLHADADEDYCRQVVAEELLVKPSGKRIWIRRKRDNHYLDAEVNAYAAALSLHMHALPPPKVTVTPQQEAPRARDPFVPRSNGGWFRR